MIVTVLAKETSHMAMEMKHKYFKTTDCSTILRFQTIKTLGAQRNQSEPRLKALVHKLTSALAGYIFHIGSLLRYISSTVEILNPA